MLNDKAIHIISVASGIAAGDSRCQFGPQHLKQSALMQALALELIWEPEITPSAAATGLAAMPVVAKICEQIAKQVSRLCQQHKTFVTLGGDHSCAAGTWSGVAHAYRDQGDIGLLWLDAHLDSHTSETSETGNIHGMPLAALLGYGDPLLTQILDKQAKLKPENLVIIGARSYESGEQALLETLGVKIYYMDDVKQRGMATVFQEALLLLKQNTIGFGISLDLDGFDPTQAPGTGIHVPDGFLAEEILPELRSAATDPQLLGFELVEFSPVRDQEQKTEKLVKAIFETIYCNS